MTGEQLFIKFQADGPLEYSNLLLAIYAAIGDKLFPILSKAEKLDKKIAVEPIEADNIIRDISENDVIFV